MPDYSLHLLTGASYDGFLGEPAGVLSRNSGKWTRIAARARYGTPRQKILAWLNIAGRKILHIKNSASTAETLMSACLRLALDNQDLVVVPTADLDTLEAAQAVAQNFQGKAPQFCLRFLGADFGEIDVLLRRQRLSAVPKAMGRSIHLFTETDELAEYLRAEFGWSVEGEFYLPCGVDPARFTPQRLSGTPWRIGIFGAPRAEKGSGRVRTIINHTFAASELDPSAIEFVIQGSDLDFGAGGVYEGLLALRSLDGKVRITSAGENTTPAEYENLFSSVNAVLLPYDANIYGLQGSGIVLDAVAARKMIIHSAGMSMKKLLSHGNGRPAQGDAEFASQICRLSRETTDLSDGLLKAHRYLQNRLKDHPLATIARG